MTEQWKEHPVHRDYEGSTEGNIRHKGKEVRQIKNKKNYLFIHFGSKSYWSHRFIYECFNGPIPAGLVIDHINTIRTDNRPSNLRLVTTTQNNRNPLTIAKLINHKNLSKRIIQKENEKVIGYFPSTREAERQTGVNHSNISASIRGKTKNRYQWEYTDKPWFLLEDTWYKAGRENLFVLHRLVESLSSSK